MQRIMEKCNINRSDCNKRAKSQTNLCRNFISSAPYKLIIEPISSSWLEYFEDLNYYFTDWEKSIRNCAVLVFVFKNSVSRSNWAVFTLRACDNELHLRSVDEI